MFIIITDATISAEILSFLQKLTAIAAGQTAVLSAIQTQGVKIMASLADVQASQAAEDTEIKALIVAAQAAQSTLTQQSVQIAALQAQIAAGSPVTAADLDAIKADMDAQAAAIGTALAPAAPAPGP